GFRPREVLLDGLRIDRLVLGKGVAGQELEYSVHSGGIAYLPSGVLSGDLEISGDAVGRVGLNATLTGRRTDRLELELALAQLVKPTFGLDHLSGKGSVTIAAEGIDALLEVALAKGGWQGRVATPLHYAGGKLRFPELALSSPGHVAQGDLSLDFTPGRVGVAVDATYQDAKTNRYEVAGSAAVAMANGSWAIEVDSLKIGGWETVLLALAGTVRPGSIALGGALREFDIGALPVGALSNFHGRVTGDLSISGSLEDPQIDAGIRVAGFTSVEDALDELPELDFEINAGVVNGRLFGATSLTNYVSGHLTADFQMPCAFSLVPFHYRPEVRHLDARLAADLDLSVLNRLAMFQNQLVEGLLTVDLSYEDLEPSGHLWITDGRYEHYDWGFLFRDFNAAFEAVPGGFKVGHAKATDGSSGTVAMAGGMGREGLDLQLDFAGANLIRRDETDARVSGTLTVKGRPLRPDVAGTITVDRAEILLGNMASPPPAVLTDFDRHATNRLAAAGKKLRKAPPVGLDVHVGLPDQVFVNSSMIEATLGGNLHITDAPNGVSIKGKLEPRRGFVSFIGKKFRFTDGSILLDGSVPAVVFLENLTAEYSRSDVTAKLVLNGRANDPQYSLASTPFMPEDEILSHVLFNRDTSSISPYQAIQIAAAARQLSGGANGPGFMYHVRKVVGVDTLEWRESNVEGEASEVAAGKYISSGLYVEVSRSLDARGETGMMAELEVTRHLSLETYTGPELRPGIGVNWRNDY
ncbi:translocation/assembly module TamB domain-containing protein, partial [Pontiella sp.]|uniref:translocation/assembly module TamB domain-containing protein n=1 Tax=Pontiella sp. TaxID=2837462 RepID=UPI003565E2C2